ncbi:hypothetical protein HDU99_004834 [Rhizoclosmatium hyalinum]|nr:hypothetical protein HDU99_004834 [Rhizoclosmatium hyalinum]
MISEALSQWQLAVAVIAITTVLILISGKPKAKHSGFVVQIKKPGKPTDAIYHPSSFSLTNIPSLEGKVAVVTGGNTGIGFHTVKHLALNGAKVFMAARSQEKAESAIATIKQEASALGKTVQIEFLKLDLADLAQVKKAGKNLAENAPVIDIVVCNAGITIVLGGNKAVTNTKNGLESHFATNHLGHYMFIQLLLPGLLKMTNKPRIVMLSSSANWLAPTIGIDFDSILTGKPEAYGGQYYGQSKLANILFATELNTRFGSQLIVNTLHPGVVDTDLIKFDKYSFTWFLTRIVSFKTLLGLALGEVLSPEKGAYCSLYAATSEEIVEKGIQGKYLKPFGVVSDDHHPLAMDHKLSAKLWEFSEDICYKVHVEE